MTRTLRAFAWLRWRMFINSLEKTGARDTVERFSLAIEKLGPIMAAVMMIPSALGLAVLGTAGGYALAAGNPHSILFEIGRYLLLPVTLLCIVGPLILPAADRTNPVRLLLLPISRATLYLAQSASSLGDPWILLMIPFAGGVALGLAVGGALAPALVAIAAAAIALAALVGLSSLATSLLHLAVRDRRRGELLALLFILILPMIGVLPEFLGSRHRHRESEGGAGTRQERTLPPWVAAAGERAFGLLPSELYTSATRAASQGDFASAGLLLAGLALGTAILHGLAMLAFGRVLDAPESIGARRSAPMREAWRRRLPGLSAGASAVALAHLRLALRTARGRSIMLSPVIMLVICGVIVRQKAAGAQITLLPFQSGVGVASFASFLCLLTMLPIAMNQFAVDRAGLTLVLLSPLTDREYLTGKAVGNALVAVPPALVAVLGSFALFPGGSPAAWIALPIALAAVYLIVAPAAAIASALFPRAVDLNSIGRRGNAHGLAGLIGFVAFIVAAAPCAVLALIALNWLDRPLLLPALLLGWCAIAYGISALLFIPARRIFRSRRENLAMMRGTP
jgi:hypothetical protein